MRTPEGRFGAPFDMALRLSTQLEDGRSLGDITELVPVTAHIVSLLSDASVGREAAAIVNNQLRALAETTPQGEPTILAAPAYLRWVFDGRRTVRHYADWTIAKTGVRWVAAAGNDEGAAREQAIAATLTMDGLDALMVALQHDDQGRRLLGEYDDELARSLRAKRPKAKDLPFVLHNAEASFTDRLAEAGGNAARRAADIAGAYAIALDAEVRKAVDQAGLCVGHEVADAALGRVRSMEEKLLDQRETLKVEVELAEAEATSAFETLQEAAAQVVTGWLKGMKQPFAVYTKAATNAFRLRFALALTEAALAALGSTSAALGDLASLLAAFQRIVSRIAERTAAAVRDFEARDVTPVEEITERPLYDNDELRALYQETCGVPWPGITEEITADIWQRLGGLARLLGEPEERVYEELLTATSPLFERVAAMTADDFVRWKYGRQGRPADLLLRDSELVAPALCRFDRARLPDSRERRDATFVIVGVPDRDRSVFLGTSRALLVTTGDPSHIVFLRLKLGYPPSALWQFPRYHAAFEQVENEGRVAQGIYRGFRHGLWRQWHAGPTNGRRKRRPGPNKKRKRR